jgi:SWI/SNF-related matrix-associated actin-dependent regulator of chromatin subfamily A protein 2/4
VPPELKLACALERKALLLAHAQRALRAEVSREAHLRGRVPPAAGAMPAARWDTLADLSLLRRPLPAAGRGPLPETAAEARASAAAAAAAQRASAAAAAVAAAARAADEAARRAEGARANAAAAERLSAAAAAAAAASDPAARAAAAAAARERALADMRMRIIAARRRFCASATAAATDFRKHFVAGVFRRRRARNDGVMAFHARERAKLQRVETKRLQALRANDEEGYLRLVQESKNERLNTLLHKTAQLLAALGDKIKATQAAAAAGEEGVELVADDDDAGAGAGGSGAGGAGAEEGGGGAGDGAGPSGEGADGGDSGGADLLARRRAYASAAHAITELVTVQPAMLVGPHGDGKLRGYQLAGVQWMVSLYNNNLNGILADEMGLGKTIQTIALLAYLQERKGHRGPHLIVCPKAVLPNWAAEFAAWAPDLDVILYDGRPDERAALRGRVVAGAAGRGFCALLTHYDMIMRDKGLLAKLHWSYIIIDEGHRMKNRESRLAEVLCASYKSRHRLLLTGTPIQNNMGELWALLNFLLPAIFASAESFASWFNAPFAGTKEDVALNEEEELVVINRLHQARPARATRDALRRLGVRACGCMHVPHAPPDTFPHTPAPLSPCRAIAGAASLPAAPPQGGG